MPLSCQDGWQVTQMHWVLALRKGSYLQMCIQAISTASWYQNTFYSAAVS